MDVWLIQVPYHAGDDRHPASEGPARLVDAGAAELVRTTAVERVDRGEPFRDTAASAAAVNRRLAEVVARSIEAGALPIVLAGSCNSCLGVLAGFDHSRCGAVWLDAHADFNTPDSSLSGFFPGMSLAIATGHCYRDYWGQPPLAEESVVLFGLRDLSPEAERVRLGRSAIRVGSEVSDLDGLPVEEVYLHIDFDGFAPEVAPGVADEPVPGGLTLEDAQQIIRAAAERFRICAVTLATYTPANDEAERTLRLGLALIEELSAL